jgi:hypothetical protein
VAAGAAVDARATHVGPSLERCVVVAAGADLAAVAARTTHVGPSLEWLVVVAAGNAQQLATKQPAAEQSSVA